MIEGQTSIFEMLYPTYKITKPIRLIEFFAGYGSQCAYGNIWRDDK